MLVIEEEFQIYRRNNDYLIASLMLAFGIIIGFNPLLLTVGFCIIPKETSKKQTNIMTLYFLTMLISWIVYTALGLALVYELTIIL